MIYLILAKCLNHPKSLAVNLEREDGTGLRLTPFKCCGLSDTVKRWPIDHPEDIVNEIQRMAEERQP